MDLISLSTDKDEGAKEAKREQISSPLPCLLHTDTEI